METALWVIVGSFTARGLELAWPTIRTQLTRVYWWAQAKRGVRGPGDDVDRGVRAAFAACGLNTDLADRPDFDLTKTGKLHEVLAHASTLMGEPRPVRTVADVKAAFRLGVRTS